MEPPVIEHEGPFGPRREALFAVLAVASVLIGISRIENPMPAPLWMQVVDVLIASAFFVDWVSRVRAAAYPMRYLATHAYEVLFFIPFTLLPTAASGGNILRGGRLLRLLRFARYARYTKVGLSLSRLPRRLRHLGHIAKNAQLIAIFVFGAVAVSLGAVGLLLSEQEQVGTFAESLWWSLSLFTTVAYAVPDPSTVWGRTVSGALMVAGVVYVGIFTASLASAILRTPEEE